MNSYTVTLIIQFTLFTTVFILLKTNLALSFLQSSRKFKICLIFLILVQLICIAVIKKDVGDILVNNLAGWYLRQQIDFYYIDQFHSQYPFLPFLIFFHGLFNFLFETNNFFIFSFYIKLFCLLALYFIGLQIYSFQKKESVINARILTLQFLSSPVTYLIVLFHGQYDVILLSFLLICLMIINKNSSNLPSLLSGGIFYGLAILTKTWPVILMFSLINQLKNPHKILVFFLASFLIIVFDLGIYLLFIHDSNLKTILPALIRPGGPVGIWGITFLFSSQTTLLEFISKYNIYLFGGLFSLFQLIIFRKKLALFSNIFLTILSVYLISANWGVQYLFWIVPFTFLINKQLKRLHVNLFFLFASIYLFLFYLKLALNPSILTDFIVNLSGLILWIFLIYWFSYLFKARLK